MQDLEGLAITGQAAPLILAPVALLMQDLAALATMDLVEQPTLVREVQLMQALEDLGILGQGELRMQDLEGLLTQDQAALVTAVQGVRVIADLAAGGTAQVFVVTNNTDVIYL
jgi:aspartate oxidase